MADVAIIGEACDAPYMSTDNSNTDTDSLKAPGSRRVWIDGCFDLVHYGHANALRQAKEMGDYLLVGVISDEEIQKAKGFPPVLNEHERSEMIRAIRWVDEVVDGVPFGTTHDILAQYNCAFCVHGDDLIYNEEGKHVYETTGLVSAGKFNACSRTEGVSTTNLINRILSAFSCENGTLHKQVYNEETFSSPSVRMEDFDINNGPKPGDRIVYTAGDFDLYQLDPIELIRRAAQFGDYLIVGVYSDKEVAVLNGKPFPFLNLQERALNILSNKYVSEVVTGAPYEITDDFIQQFNIDLIVHSPSFSPHEINDPIKALKNKTIVRTLDVQITCTKETVIERIIQKRNLFEKRNKIRAEKDCQQKELVLRLNQNRTKQLHK